MKYIYVAIYDNGYSFDDYDEQPMFFSENYEEIKSYAKLHNTVIDTLESCYYFNRIIRYAIGKDLSKFGLGCDDLIKFCADRLDI